MSDRRFLISVTTIIMIVLTATLTSAGTYTEDFTTTEFRDSLNTTAWWDTTAGEVKLFPLPVLAGSFDTPGFATDVFVDGNHAYVGDGGSGLQVLDISDPANPVLAGALPGSIADGVHVSGDHAYIADGAGGFRAIDVSDPSNPVSVGAIGIGDDPFGVYVAGDHAYVASGFSGLQVIDISDPTSLTLAGGVGTPDIALGVWVAGNHAYVADGSSGLQVIDISDPTNPTIVGAFDTPSNANGVQASGDHAYVADLSGGLQVIDISDPTNPVLAGSIATNLAQDVDISGDRAFVTDGGSLLVVDITDPTNPTLTATIDSEDFAYRVMVAGDHAYVADGGSGLQVIQVAGDIPPSLAGALATPNEGDKLDVSGDHAYLADDNLLVVIDISDITNPLPVGSVAIPNLAAAVAISGDHAYVANHSSLEVIDISDPTNPFIVGSGSILAGAERVRVSGDHAYVAAGFNGLVVVDIFDPTNPTQVGILFTDVAGDVAVSGNHAYVADASSGLLVIDITDPTNPTLAGSQDTPDSAVGVAVSGNHAYVADLFGGLQVIDISDPTNPLIAGSLDIGSAAFGVSVSGDRACVTSHLAGLTVIDVSDPTNPTLIGSIGTGPFGAFDVTVSGANAFVADFLGLAAVRVAQVLFDPIANRGQSLRVSPPIDAIVRARLTTTQTDEVEWAVSADNGGNWQDVLPGENWTELVAGSDLLWRSTHVPNDHGVNPTVSELTLEWLNEFSAVSSIVDVGNDQGRQVSITWSRSGHDFVGDPSQITEYSVYRRIDSAGDAAAGASVTSSSSLNPPGWHFIATVPSDAEDAYAIVAPTLVDSTETEGVQWSVFMVRARVSPGVFFDSPPDSGYSIDNLAPGVPMNVAFDTPQVLVWDEATDEDFAYHTIYGSETDVFDETAVLIDFTIEPTFDVSTHPFAYYHVTTADHAGNESGASSIQSDTIGVAENEGAPPQVFALSNAQPNPFRSTTSIAFDLAAASPVRLVIYDTTGRQVRVLTDSQQNAGRYQISWDGVNEAGERVARGIYFVNLKAGSFRASSRVVVLR